MPLVALTNWLILTKVGELAVRPTDLLFVAAWMLWGLKVAMTMRLERRLLTYFSIVSALVAVTFLGILLLGNSVDWPRYLRYIQTLSWGALAFSFLGTERRFDTYLKVVVLLGVIMGAVSLGLYLVNPTLHRIAGYFSFAGGEGLDRQASYNEWGAVYALSLTILLWRLYRRALSLLQLGAAGIILTGLLLVQSRSAFLSIAAVITILLVLYSKRFYQEGAYRRSVFGVLVLLSPIIFVIIASRGLAVNRLLETFVPGSGADVSMASRLTVWQTSLDLWNAGPHRFFLGYGHESFANLIDSPTADNFYLDHGLSEGIVGLLLFLSLLTRPVLTTGLSRPLDPRVVLGALVVVIALTVSLTGNVLVDPTYGGVTFSLLYGLLAIHDRRVLRTQPR